jgi:hypothetical protein
MDPHVNGAGAVDLAALKAQAAQKEAFAEQREQLAAQLLAQAGLLCPCGERIRGDAVIYFTLVEAAVPTPQGTQLGLQLVGMTCCSQTCAQAVLLEQQAIARRNGPAGRVTWLDERRAARQAREDR